MTRSMSLCPKRVATCMATQRKPLPHISGVDPSALTTIILAAASVLSGVTTRSTPSAPIPKCRSHNRSTTPGAKAARGTSMTMKSLPSPSYFLNATRPTLQSYRLVARLPMLVWAGRHPHLGAGSIFE